MCNNIKKGYYHNNKYKILIKINFISFKEIILLFMTSYLKRKTINIVL